MQIHNLYIFPKSRLKNNKTHHGHHNRLRMVSKDTFSNCWEVVFVCVIEALAVTTVLMFLPNRPRWGTSLRCWRRCPSTRRSSARYGWRYTGIAKKIIFKIIPKWRDMTAWSAYRPSQWTAPTGRLGIGSSLLWGDTPTCDVTTPL